MIEITETSKWFAVLWHPWGRTIHRHYEQFVHLGGTIRRISKHVTGEGSFRFFCFVPHNGPHVIRRERSYRKILQHVREDVQCCLTNENRSTANS